MASWTQSGKPACVLRPSASIPPAFPVPPCSPCPSLLPKMTAGTCQTGQSTGPCSSLLPLVSCSHTGSYCVAKSPQGKPGEFWQALQAVEHSSSTPCSHFLKAHCSIFPASTLNQFLTSAVNLARIWEDLPWNNCTSVIISVFSWLKEVISLGDSLAAITITLAYVVHNPHHSPLRFGEQSQKVSRKTMPLSDQASILFLF